MKCESGVEGKITVGNYKVGRESTGPQLNVLVEIESTLFTLCDGSFILLKENLGQTLDEREALDQKSMFQQKDDHSGKQKAELSFNYIAPAHNVIYSH